MSEETTARPWEVRKDHMGSWWVADMGQRKVAYVGHCSDPRAEGDARIIAAAPDLLAALEGMECGGCHLKMTEAYNRPCPDCAPAFVAIRAARGLEDT